MMPRFTATLFAVLFVLLFVCSGAAQSPPATAVPNLINFSGTLPEAGGGAISATTGVTFAIYKQQEGGAPLWMETQNVTPDAAGHYTVLLGSTKTDGVPAELFSEHEERWLGVQVQGQTEQPRVLLVSVPYAMKAAEADRLAGHNASEFVTTDKLQSTVQQQMQQQGMATTYSVATPGTKAANGNNAPITTNPATNFTDTTTDQVVLVTQNGTGSGLKATAANVGVYSISTGTSSSSIGVFGTSKGIGVKGQSTDAAGSSAGIQGTSSAPTGYAIYGSETATTGLNYGVFGTTASTSGIGLRGAASATTGSTTGLYGSSASATGVGIKAISTATSGSTYGLVASIRSGSGVAGLFQNLAEGGTFLRAITGSLGSETEQFKVDGSGNVTARGGVTVQGAITAPVATFSGTVTANSFSGSGTGLTGVAPASGSPNYIQNGMEQQTGNFYISGSGRVGQLLGAGSLGVSGTSTLGSVNAGRLIATSLTSSILFSPSTQLTLELPGNGALVIQAVQDSINMIGGWIQNTVANGVGGATVAGGGASGAVNSVTASFGTISGGNGNTASGAGSTVSGGTVNAASAGNSNVGGGGGNTAGGDHSSVSGGDTNTADGDHSTVGGGLGNVASGTYSVIPGGQNNTASGNSSSILGGQNNTASAQNTVAAGHNASATFPGSFVWGDSSNFPVLDTASNQFVARSVGGVTFISAIDGSGNATAGVNLAPGSGSWSMLSDRDSKDEFTAVDGAELLARLNQIPLMRWHYKAQGSEIRHMGPVAQDFRAAFGLGEDEKHISTVDAEGVALAAIQALYRQVQQLQQERDHLATELDQKTEQLQVQTEQLLGENQRQRDEFQQRLSRLEAIVQAAGTARGAE